MHLSYKYVYKFSLQWSLRQRIAINFNSISDILSSVGTVSKTLSLAISEVETAEVLNAALSWLVEIYSLRISYCLGFLILATREMRSLEKQVFFYQQRRVLVYEISFDGVHPLRNTRPTITYKGKSISIQAWTGPESPRSLRFPDFKTIGSQVVSPRHRLPLSHRKYSWYSFLLEVESNPGL